MSAKTLTAAEIATLVRAEATASEAVLTRVSALEGATEEAIVFAQDEGALAAALASAAGLILAPAKTRGDAKYDARILWVRDAKYAFAVCARALAETETGPLIHPSAVVHESAKLGQNVRVGACAVIEAEAVIGDDTAIGSGVTVCRGAELGSRCVVQSGAVLGATGFGYEIGRAHV